MDAVKKPRFYGAEVMLGGHQGASVNLAVNLLVRLLEYCPA
jgi:hypothetical protein